MEENLDQAVLDQAAAQRQIAEFERQREELAKVKEELAKEKKALVKEKEDLDKEKKDFAEEKKDFAEEKENLEKRTLTDCINASHELISCRLEVETNLQHATAGTINSPVGKACPTILTRWLSFEDDKDQVLRKLYDNVASKRLFESYKDISVRGAILDGCYPVASEKALEKFMYLGIELTVKTIIDGIRSCRQTSEEINVGGSITFENYTHYLSEVADEVVDQTMTASTSAAAPQTPDGRGDCRPGIPDQICIHHTTEGGREIAYISEYKAPHKLTSEQLRAGLQDMDIHKKVVNRQTIPNLDDEEHPQYQAERKTAAAITQTFNYMIEEGLEFGLLSTGEATVFLRVDWEDPTTLYYHLADFAKDAADHQDNISYWAAVAQHLALTLMAIEPSSLSTCRGITQGAREEAKHSMNCWVQEPLPESSVKTSPERSSPWQPDTPTPKRAKRKRCKDDQDSPSQKRKPPPSDDTEPRPWTLPGQPSAQNEGGSRRRDFGLRRRGPKDQDATANEQVELDYCTQACLLGVVRSGPLDPKCPNVAKHTCAANVDKTTRHPLSHTQWLSLLQQQIQETMDDGMVKLEKGGSRGVLFKVTLLSHGYTFVCKGTIEVFIRDLKHEHDVYRRLEKLQGKQVPVFLGAIDLRPMRKTYYYAHRVYIVHLTFLSWGGETLRGMQMTRDEALDIEEKALRSLRKVHELGVEHNDSRTVNMLLNKETGEVMIIDFERATLHRAVNRALVLARHGADKGRRRISGHDTMMAKGEIRELVLRTQ